MSHQITSRELLYGGTPPGARHALRAGPLTMTLEAGSLRYLTCGGVELLRGLYAAVRNHNWETISPTFSDFQLTTTPNSFEATFAATFQAGEVDFHVRYTLTGLSDGGVCFAFRGLAHKDFRRNRIGLCVLHPLSAAGATCRLEHVNGSAETATLPVHIVPDQPVPPFTELRTLEHEAAPGVWAKLTFLGDTFEMEDQRNWTDASFKTFCTPLHLPYPVYVPAGTVVEQSVTLSLRLEQAVVASSKSTCTIDLGRDRSPLPLLGVGLAHHGQTLSERELARLRKLHLAHLRVELAPSAQNWMAVLERAVGDAQALGIPLEAAVVLTDTAAQELRSLRGAIEDLRPNIVRWLVFHRTQHVTPEWLIDLARSQLTTGKGAEALGGGTNSDFFFLNRTPVKGRNLDFVCLAVNPQVHAFDHASLIETLLAQSVVAQNAWRLGGGVPVVVSPVTLKPRFNPYAAGTPPTQAGELPSCVDPRQMSLFGAVWTLGSLKALATSGAVASATFFETTGWLGLMEQETGSLLPECFPSLPGAVFPLYFVFADVGSFSGGQVVGTTSSDPLTCDALVLEKGERRRALVANFRAEPVTVTVGPLSREVYVAVLDEANVLKAVQAPDAWLKQRGDKRITSGELELSLPPFALARVDELGQGAQ